MAELHQGLKALADRRARLKTYRDYLQGDHRLKYATQKYLNAFAGLFEEFAVNYIPRIVGAVADRLEVTGFGEQGVGEGASVAERREAGGLSDLEAQAWEIWERNRMDTRAGQIHREALINGDGFLIVWPDAQGFPVFYPQESQLCHVQYDMERPGVIAWALKAWTGEDDRSYATLYFPDRIEKYVSARHAAVSAATGFASYRKRDVPGESWPLPNPYGRVPVFHLPADPDIRGLGRSEIADALPLQDALTKTCLDMLVAMEFQAFRQRWVTGLEVKKDPKTGLPIPPYVPGEDRLWVATNKDVKFGTFEQSDPTGYIDVCRHWREELARVTGTPLHYMTAMAGAPPSGEALRVLEAPLVKKTRDRAATFGNGWEDAMQFALTVRRGEGPLIGTRLAAEWSDPESVSTLEKITGTQNLTAAGAGLYQAARVAGFAEAAARELARADVIVEGMEQ
jgi:hypothetical protein